MAVDMHITEIKGQKQGDIKGSVATKGHEGQIRVLNYEYSGASPRDGQGQATGRRQHSPFSITKSVDKSTPILFQAFVNNETLTKIKLQVIRSTDTAGKKDETIWEFDNSQICGITSGIDVGVTDDMTADGTTSNTETIQFVFQKITITHTNGGIVGMDTWDADIRTS